MVSSWAIQRLVGTLFECRYIDILVLILLGRSNLDYKPGVSRQTKDPDLSLLFVAGLWDNNILLLFPMQRTHGTNNLLNVDRKIWVGVLCVPPCGSLPWHERLRRCFGVPTYSFGFALHHDLPFTMIWRRLHTLDVAKWSPNHTYTVVIVHPHGSMNMLLAAGLVPHAFRRGYCTSSQIAVFPLRVFKVGTCGVSISTAVTPTATLFQHRNRKFIGAVCYRCTAVSDKRLNVLGKEFQVIYVFRLYFNANIGAYASTTYPMEPAFTRICTNIHEYITIQGLYGGFAFAKQGRETLWAHS